MYSWIQTSPAAELLVDLPAAESPCLVITVYDIGPPTQPTIALSSGEAELGGLAKGSAQGISLRTIAADLGWKLGPRIHSDATAAIGISKRRGVGKIRHLSTADLWIQERQREGDLEILKVLGADNPGDALTKYVERILLAKHMGRIRVYPEEGRAASAPQIIAQITRTLGRLEDGTVLRAAN